MQFNRNYRYKLSGFKNIFPTLAPFQYYKAKMIINTIIDCL